jgi:S-layer homology domain
MSASSRSIFRWFPLLAIACSVPLLAQDAPVALDASLGTHGVGSPAPRKQSPHRPETYGTSKVSYIRIDASEMDPLATVNQFSAINNAQLRYLTNVAGLGLMAPIHLPSGALITYVELDFYDNSATGEVQASIGVCGYTGETCNFYVGDLNGCSDASIALCSGNTDMNGFSQVNTDMTSDGIIVDNFQSRYIFAIGNTTNDGSTAISQIVVGYVLTVSPAPATATFGDVPTDHPFFQFIEALAASGITGGCGSGNYCPDAPLTRGQMAVFLSKALGLQWQ